MIRGTPNTVLPGGERRSDFYGTSCNASCEGAYKKQHARESVFRSERMPESIDHHAAAAVWEERRKKMKHVNVRKLALAGILVAVGIVCSPLSIPVGASKCAPVQHFINILGGVFLGPAYAVGMAFVTSLLRNLLGTGTLLAFPGSMCGAFLCGMLYKYGKHLPWAYVGELFGTSVIGGLLSWPVATWLMGSESAVYGFIIPFFVSSFGGTILAVVLVTAMKRMKVFDIYLGNLEPQAKHV